MRACTRRLPASISTFRRAGRSRRSAPRSVRSSTACGTGSRLGRRGRSSGPVAAGRDRGGRRRQQRTQVRDVLASVERFVVAAPDIELLDVETAWLEISRDARRASIPRTARVNEVMLEVLADELERMSDPRLELVTFTGVDVSRDLVVRKVYYSTLGARRPPTRPRDVRRRRGRRRCESAASHLRGVVGRQMRIRQVPALTFDGRSRHRRRAAHRRDPARDPPRTPSSRTRLVDARRRGGVVSSRGPADRDVDDALDARGCSDRAAPRVALACHVNPDGDALGSMLGAAPRAPRRRHRLASRRSPSRSSSRRTTASCPGLDLLTPPDRVPARARR